MVAVWCCGKRSKGRGSSASLPPALPTFKQAGLDRTFGGRVGGPANVWTGTGYEDLNDHDQLRRDPLLAVLVDKEDPTGADRRRVSDQGMALAGRSTLNRLELGGKQKVEPERYKKIILEGAAVDRLLVEIFLQSHPLAPSEMVLDVTAPIFPCMASRKVVFSTVSTDSTVICRCTSCVGSTCCARACDPQILMAPKDAWPS